MKEENLEEKVNAAMASLSLFGAVLASLYLGCAPSLKVPVTVAKERNVSCCELLACSSKDYDYCKDEGTVYENGQQHSSCECKDYASSSSTASTSSSRDYDRPGPGDRDRGTDRGGSWKCPR